MQQVRQAVAVQVVPMNPAARCRGYSPSLLFVTEELMQSVGELCGGREAEYLRSRREGIEEGGKPERRDLRGSCLGEGERERVRRGGQEAVYRVRRAVSDRIGPDDRARPARVLEETVSAPGIAVRKACYLHS